MIDKKVIYTLISVDVGIAIFTFLQGNYIWFINTQIGFFSSFAVAIGSYISYRNNVLQRVENYEHRDNVQDDIDKIDDPYQLYDEDDNKKDELSEKEIIKLEKSNLKKNTLKNSIKSFKAYGSIYRLLGYIFLVLGFFYLQGNELLDIPSYIIGISTLPFSLLIVIFMKKNQNIEKNS